MYFITVNRTNSDPKINKSFTGLVKTNKFLFFDGMLSKILLNTLKCILPCSSSNKTEFPYTEDGVASQQIPSLVAYSPYLGCSWWFADHQNKISAGSTAGSTRKEWRTHSSKVNKWNLYSLMAAALCWFGCWLAFHRPWTWSLKIKCKFPVIIKISNFKQIQIKCKLHHCDIFQSSHLNLGLLLLKSQNIIKMQPTCDKYR